jgi:hypothetical protein
MHNFAHRPSAAVTLLMVMLPEPDIFKCVMQEIKAKFSPLNNMAGKVSFGGGVPHLHPTPKLKAGYILC